MYPTNALSTVIEIVFGLYAGLVLARLILQLVQADFYNPFSQMIVKFTNPLLVPLRRIIPPAGKIDSASVLLIFAIIAVELVVLVLLNHGVLVPIGSLIVNTLYGFARLVLQFYFMTIFIGVVLSWIADPYHPLYQLIGQVNEPLLGPIRKAMPDMGPMDFSPMIAILILIVLRSLFGI